jgi:hypothetical protein
MPLAAPAQARQPPRRAPVPSTVKLAVLATAFSRDGYPNNWIILAFPQSLKETTDSQRWEEPLQDRDKTNQRDQDFKQVSETPVANEPVDEIKAYCTDDDGD